MQQISYPVPFTNSETFLETLKAYHLQKMRSKIYIHMLRNNQNDFFDLELFDRTYVKDMKVTDAITEIVIKELEELGWKTFIGYGGTGLFIYDKEKPKSAW